MPSSPSTLIIIILAAAFFCHPILSAEHTKAEDAKEETAFDWDLGGYFKNLVFYSDLGGDDFSNLQRLRLKLNASFLDSFDLRVHYELRSLWTEADLKADGGAAVFGLPVIARQPFFDFEHTLISDPHFRLSHGLDRLRVRYRSDTNEISLGRQAISWGTGLIWNPNDLFAGFSPTAIDRDDKPGVDAARWMWTPSQWDPLAIDLVVGPASLDGSYGINADDSDFAARISYRIGEFDLSAQSSYLAGDIVTGIDFAGYAGDAGVRGEISHTHPRESNESGFTRLLVGTDYSPPAPWSPYFALEYFYNGLGVSDQDDYLNRLAVPVVQRAFARGNAFNIGQHYLGLTASAKPSALWAFNTTATFNLKDTSLRLLVGLTWSLADNIDLELGGILGFGGRGTEFGPRNSNPPPDTFPQSPNTAFAFLKFYF